MQYRTRAAKNDSASAYRFYRNAKNLQARRSNPASPSRAMDCFAEPVIGRRFAPTRWLAMTVFSFH
jgi:hypothetical protein